LSKSRSKNAEFPARRRRQNLFTHVEKLEPRLLLSIYEVVNTNDAGPGSLRDAINQVDNGAFDTIDFKIPGSGPFTIAPSQTNGPLPPITRPVLVDGTSQPGFDTNSPAPIIQIDGQNNPNGVGLELAIGSDGSTIKDLNIYGFSGGIGIYIESNDDVVQGSYLGTDVTGEIAQPNQTGLLLYRFAPSSLEGSAGNVTGTTIGGSVAAARNLISGNQVGIAILSAPPLTNPVAGNNLILGNYIGIANDGTPIPNVLGVWVNDVPGNQIGAPGAGNMIVGNTEAGVYINGAKATGNKVQGNVIGPGLPGLAIAGVGPAENPFPIGVYIQDSSTNTIGGTGAFGNSIEGNNVGIYILGHPGSAFGNVIEGNQINNNNLYGVMLYNAPHNFAPQSGPLANQIVGSGIANYREFLGPVAATPQTISGQGSSTVPGSSAKKPAHHSSHGAHQSPRRTSSHAAVTVHGRQVPAGPIRKQNAHVSI